MGEVDGALIGSSTLRAQGFGFYQHGTCTMCRAGATVEAPCNDGSALFFNPAGLVGPAEWTINGGETALFGNGSFIDD